MKKALLATVSALMELIGSAKMGENWNEVGGMSSSISYLNSIFSCDIIFHNKDIEAGESVLLFISHLDDAERLGSVYSDIYTLFNQNRIVLLEEVRQIKEAYNI